MKENFEIEYKNLLTKEEYHRLVHHFQEVESIEMTSWVQHNYYFDTAELSLKAYGAALRIRIFEDERAEITLKTPLKGHLLERNEAIPYSKAIDMVESGRLQLSSDFQQPITDMDIQPSCLSFLASMTTKRQEGEHEACLIVLDQSTYLNGKQDYELEIEGPSEKEALDLFHRILDQHQIDQRPSQNKIERAFRYNQSKPGR